MATPTKIHLTVDDTGIVPFKPVTSQAAAKASECLQENHEKFHIFYNDGFHNHIVHHILSLYGLGAPADIIEKHYRLNASYQQPALPIKKEEIQDMSNPSRYASYLGRPKYYSDFLHFFQAEMEKKGWENVLNEYVFAGDERADELLMRMYAGFLHPLIHLGFGIEFNQPAIMAEALAEAAVHDIWIGTYLGKCEAASKTNGNPSTTLPSLISAIHSDPKLSTAAHWSDGNKIRDGILVRAPEEMINLATKWTVTPETLHEKTAEMIHSAIYFTAAAQRPPKQVKFDFYLMHSTNCGIFFPSFNAAKWLSTENKVRMLKLKAWMDLAMYASRKAPGLLMEEIAMYVPKGLERGEGEWKGVFGRLLELEDDGHSVKLGRAVRNGELVSKEWEEKGREWVMIKSWMWEKVGNMVVDSVEDTGERWVRSAGFEEAWDGFEDRKRVDKL